MFSHVELLARHRFLFEFFPTNFVNLDEKFILMKKFRMVEFFLPVENFRWTNIKTVELNAIGIWQTWGATTKSKNFQSVNQKIFRQKSVQGKISA